MLLGGILLANVNCKGLDEGLEVQLIYFSEFGGLIHLFRRISNFCKRTTGILRSNSKSKLENNFKYYNDINVVSGLTRLVYWASVRYEYWLTQYIVIRT